MSDTHTTAHLPDEAVQATLEAIRSINIHDEADSYEWRGDGDYMPTPQEKALLEDFGHGLISQVEDAIRALSAELVQGARTLEEWHEDHGNVVWWAWDNDRKGWLGEPAYIGKPLDSDWPDYHTHWTPHPAFPAAPTTEAGK